MPSPVEFDVNVAELPSGFSGTWPAFIAFLNEGNISVQPDVDWCSFVIGGAEPTSDVGPWLKDGDTWYFWNDAEGRYKLPQYLVNQNTRIDDVEASLSIILTTYATEAFAEAKKEEAISAATASSSATLTSTLFAYATRDYAEAKRDEAITAAVGTAEASFAATLTAYATQDFATAKRDEAITAAAGDATAKVSAESTVTATKLGYLAGMYTLSVDTDGNIAEMKLSSISDPSGWSTSEISFLADAFKIFNGTSAVAPFQVTGGQVKITGDLVLAYSDISGTKPDVNADVTLSAINGGLTVTGGGITLDAGGALKGGAINFSTGTGFFIGYEGGQYKFRVGNPSGPRIQWDGSEWTVVGLPGVTPPAVASAPSFSFDPLPLDPDHATCTIYNNEPGAIVQYVTFTGSTGSFSGDELTLPGTFPAWQEVTAIATVAGKLPGGASGSYEFGIPP